MTELSSGHPPKHPIGIGIREEHPKSFPAAVLAPTPCIGWTHIVTLLLPVWGCRVCNCNKSHGIRGQDLILISPLQNKLREPIFTSCLIPLGPDLNEVEELLMYFGPAPCGTGRDVGRPDGTSGPMPLPPRCSEMFIPQMFRLDVSFPGAARTFFLPRNTVSILFLPRNMVSISGAAERDLSSVMTSRKATCLSRSTPEHFPWCSFHKGLGENLCIN